MFLAGKVEETPKKSRQIIEAFKVKLPGIFEEIFGENPKDSILKAEREVIENLRFDFDAKHPYQFLIKYVRKLEKIEQRAMQKLVQLAWTFINDTMSTTLCLQWEPDIIAISALYLSSKVLKLEIVEWEVFLY